MYRNGSMLHIDGNEIDAVNTSEISVNIFLKNGSVVRITATESERTMSNLRHNLYPEGLVANAETQDVTPYVLSSV